MTGTGACRGKSGVYLQMQVKYKGKGGFSKDHKNTVNSLWQHMIELLQITS